MIYVFEDYSLDPNRRELRREGQLVSVEPQVFDLLHHLIRQREQVVSKDDLIVAVWNGRIVSESTLTSRISEARHAIGDNGEAQRLIRTIPRKGHRFVGEVNEKANSPHASETAASGQFLYPFPTNLRSLCCLSPISAEIQLRIILPMAWSKISLSHWGACLGYS